MAEDCPDIIKNLEDAVEAIEEAYFTSQVEGLKSLGDQLRDTSRNLPPGAPTEKLEVLCAALSTTFKGTNSLRGSCSFNPTGCLRQVLESGVLESNPAAAGAAIAAATFVDAATGNFTPPFNVPPPSAEIGITVPSFPAEVSLPNIPEPPPREDCPDPISDLNTALESAEETYLKLHQDAVESFADSIDAFTGELGGLPSEIKADAFCVGANAAFDAAAALSASCNIDVGVCIREVLESGLIGSDPLSAGLAAGAALFADATSGSLPTVSG